MKIIKQNFGILSNGEKVNLYTISNGKMSFSAMNYGCIITAITVPSAHDSAGGGKSDDIVLGYSTLEGYINDTETYFGSFVGRFANRIANAKFTLNNKQYLLDANDGKNCLHSGLNGYNRMVWSAKPLKAKDGVGICFTRISPAGEQGFPGTLKLKVSYILTDNNELIMHYKAKTDSDTPINLTNHSYYNLAGENKGNVLSHTLAIHADTYLSVDAGLIPTGEMQSVEGNSFDFRKPKTIGQDFKESGGYDHCFCLRTGEDGLHLCAEVKEPTTKRIMTVYTDRPGVQFYSGNFLDIKSGKNGMPYEKNAGFCLETQEYPDSPNQKNFPSCILPAGKTYESTTVHKFGVY
ncbi:MAG: aldose epimerase family protein [Spirochaetales bacterium]